MDRRHVERKLAAILAADVVGYSRLIGIDELGTLKALKLLHRECVDPVISRHQGKIVKLMGDGFLAEFASAVEGVVCAVSIQHGLVQRNADVPAERRIVLRCGINLGDVVVEGKDLYGDGVNIAARLEGFCEPGGICISRTIHDQVRDKLDLAFVDLGEQRLKNIARPTRVFQLSAIEIAKLDFDEKPSQAGGGPRQLRLAGAISALTAALGGVWHPIAASMTGFLHPSARPGSLPSPPVVGSKAREEPMPRLSIVVLPFANLGGDPAQSYFADALTADITTDLSRIADSFVIAASTAFTYKDKKIEAKQIRKDLGVRYILQGGVRRTGERARVNVELVDTSNGTQIWGERFDHDVVDIVALQEDVTRQIARALNVKLVEAESRRSRRLRPDSPDALDLAMHGWAILNQPPDQDRMHEARKLFEGSVRLDPHLVSALVGLASTYVTEADYWMPSRADDYTRKAEDAISRALALDPGAAYAHQVKAWIASVRQQIPETIAEARLAIELDRNDWISHLLLSLGELMAGHPGRALVMAEQALRLSPRDPSLWAPLCLIGRARVILGESDAALDPLLRAIASAPAAAFLRVFLAAAYGRAGRDREARATIAEFLRLSPGLLSGQTADIQMAMEAQLELAVRGYYLGTIDGRAGPLSQQALRAFQHEQGIPVTGTLDDPTLSRLNIVRTRH